MPGYVCTIAGGKGGVGKTTTAINVAAALEDEGYDTVVVDADLGMANVGGILDVTAEGSIHEVLAGDRAISDALTDIEGGITVLPGERRLEAYAEADPEALSTVVRTLRDAYDVVLVDTGSGLSHETAVPMGLADGVLLVATPDRVAVEDARKTGELAERVDGEVVGIVLTRVTADTDVEGLLERFESELVAVVPEDAEAAGAEPLVLNSPDSPAAAAYRRLVTALVEVFFEGADPGALDPVVDAAWFEERPEDDDEDGGRFGGLFG